MLATALAPPAAAIAPGDCQDRDATLTFWKETADAIPADAPQLRALNASLFPRLQLGTVERTRAACELLEGLVEAQRPTRSLDLAVADIGVAAAAASQLREENVVVEPAMMEAGRAVGTRLRESIAGTPTTEVRISRLATLEDVYRASFLGAEAIEASLWRAAEEEAWASDHDRVRADLEQAGLATTRLSGLASNVLAIAQAPDLLDRLEADRALMASHGSTRIEGDRPVDDIDDAYERLEAARARGVWLALLAAALAMAFAVGLVQLARPAVRRMQADLAELDGEARA